jgi:hypothetical protein
MTLHPAVAPNEQLATRGERQPPTPTNWLLSWDALAAIRPAHPVPQWANRVLLLGLALFALAVPHSIFAAHCSLDLSLLAWVVRDVTMRKLHFSRTPLDLPLTCFASLTALSALLSVEPAVSLPKLKTLLLFGALYLLATNLRPAAVRVLLAILLVSSLAGVAFSFFEKAYGRGMVISSISANCPLRVELPPDSPLLPGDAIWMIAKQRVYSLEEAAALIRRQPNGKRLGVEVLRAGDPLPVNLVVTEELKARANPLGLTVAGRTRRFRVSGFARQFLTYAEQMQLLALLSFGLFLSSFTSSKTSSKAGSAWPGFNRLSCGLLFALFALALVFTASRAVIAAFLLALLLVSCCVSLSGGGRYTILAALLMILLLGGLSFAVIRTARQTGTTTFSDDSAARRLAYMQAGLRLIPRHPWLGVGMDSHKLHWREWGFPGEYVTHMHSTPIQLALDRGLLTLGCYIWWMAALIRLAWRGYRQHHERQQPCLAGLQLGVFGACLGFSASSLTNYNFGDSEVLLLLLLLAGLVLIVNRESTTQANLATSAAANLSSTS